MSVSALLGLLRLQLRRGRRALALSAFGVAIGIACLCFFLALSHGVEGVVLGKIFPIGQLEIVPRKTDLGAFGGLGLGGGPTPLDDRFVDALRARPEVERVYRRQKLAFPARAWGGQQLLGREVRAELVAEGLDPSATTHDDLGPEPFAMQGAHKQCNADGECGGIEYCPWDTHQCEPPVPAVISPVLVELFNTTIAKSHGLPQLGPMLLSRIRGITFTAELGRSFLGNPGAGGAVLGAMMGQTPTTKVEPHQRKMMLVGVSPAASPFALSVPIDYVRAWNAQYAGEAASKELSSVVATLKKGARSPSVAAFVRDRGYEIADSGAEQAGLAITLMTVLFALVSSAILLVATMNIAHQFLRAVEGRRRELGLLRALGATRRDLALLLLGEATVLGLSGGLLGVVTARLAALLVDLCAAKYVPEFPFKPASFFSFDWQVLAIGLGASLAACLLGALVPARMAARVEPAAALQ